MSYIDENFIVEISALRHVDLPKFGQSILVMCYRVVDNPIFGLGGVVDYTQEIRLLYPDTEKSESYLLEAKNNPKEYFEVFVDAYSYTKCNDIGDGVKEEIGGEDIYVHNSFGEIFIDNTEEGAPVDLGLSVLWADRNVGANCPSDYGILYGYGDVTGEEFSDEKSIYPKCDIVNTEKDIAKANWGNGWRMPTNDELKELAEQCRWTPSVINGVEGNLVTGPNGNTIFLPHAGTRIGPNTFRRGQLGICWSGKLSNFNSFVELMFFGYRASLNYGANSTNGNSVRPVRDK